MSSHRPLWASRARWRLYGAWRWPALAAFTLCDGLILHLLPPSASGADLAAAIIVASVAVIVRREARPQAGSEPREA